MMARYIDAERMPNDSFWDGLTDKEKAKVLQWLLQSPTADVVEVKHGEWIESFKNGCWYYDCPFCDDGFATKERCKTPPNYCGNCGAKLRGDAE